MFCTDSLAVAGSLDNVYKMLAYVHVKLSRFSEKQRSDEAQVLLSQSCVLWFTWNTAEMWPLPRSLSVTGTLQKGYIRTVDLHQRRASLVLLHLIKVLALEQKRADYSIDPESVSWRSA